MGNKENNHLQLTRKAIKVSNQKQWNWGKEHSQRKPTTHLHGDKKNYQQARNQCSDMEKHKEEGDQTK